MDYCFLCNNEIYWVLVRSIVCFEKEVEYFSWNDFLVILFMVFFFLGIMFVLVIGIIFIRNLDIFVVKLFGGLIVCYVIFFCYFFNFVNTGFFVGEL